MFEEYNNQITKFVKLLVILSGTYFAIQNLEIQIDNLNLLKLLLMIGILFIFLEIYYPTLHF